MKMSWLWLIPAGIITVVLLSCIIVRTVGKFLIRRDWNKLIREEMAAIEEEYRELCGH